MILLKEISPYVLMFSGTRDFYIDTYKHVIVDGEKYTKTQRNKVEYDYDKLYAEGKLSSSTYECFTPIFGSSVTVYYYDISDFSYCLKSCIQSEYANILGCISNFYGLKWSWGKTCNQRVDFYDFKLNDFRLTVDTYYHCSFDVSLTFQQICNLNLFEYFYGEYVDKFRLGITKRMSDLFRPAHSEAEKVDRLIDYINILSELELQSNQTN